MSSEIGVSYNFKDGRTSARMGYYLQENAFELGDSFLDRGLSLDRGGLLQFNLVRRLGKKGKGNSTLSFSVADGFGPDEARFSGNRRPNPDFSGSIGIEKITPLKQRKPTKESRKGSTKGKTSSSPVGGIDLNSAHLNLNAQGQQMKFSVPANLDELKSLNIEGFSPFIIYIAPVVNLPLLLGLDEDNDPSNDPLSDLSFNLTLNIFRKISKV